MSKREYNDEDRQAVWVTLQVNKGNVARTARDTHMPEQTVRDWKKAWEAEAPDFDPEIIEETVSVFTDRAERIRDLLMENYEKALRQGKISPDKMPIHIGIFVDKIQLLRGLATTRQEAKLALPSPEEARQLFEGVVKGALEMAKERDEALYDVDLGEQSVKELPEETS